MSEDEKIRVAGDLSTRKEGRGATLLRSLYKRRNEKEPPDLKDQAAGVQEQTLLRPDAVDAGALAFGLA